MNTLTLKSKHTSVRSSWSFSFGGEGRPKLGFGNEDEIVFRGVSFGGDDSWLIFDKTDNCD